jgi:S-adenosylmethionine synthetase
VTRRQAVAHGEDSVETTDVFIVDQLGLRRPIYRDLANYGHFGKPGLPCET